LQTASRDPVSGSIIRVYAKSAHLTRVGETGCGVGVEEHRPGSQKSLRFGSGPFGCFLARPAGGPLPAGWGWLRRGALQHQGDKANCGGRGPIHRAADPAYTEYFISDMHIVIKLSGNPTLVARFTAFAPKYWDATVRVSCTLLTAVRLLSGREC